jgi:spermidine synthase
MSGSRAVTLLLVVLAVASGMAGLVHELLYLRLLSNTLGELFQVHAALVAVFLLAMGIGAALAHRLLRWLYVFELALGLHALAFPAIVRAFEASALDRWLAPPGLHAVVASLLLLAWPAACIGLSVPCFAAYLAPRLGAAGFARSYVAFNLGAAVSLLAVEYLVLPALGYARSLAAVGMVNIAVAVWLWLMRRELAPRVAERPSVLPVEPRVLAAVFVASACSGVFTATFVRVIYQLYHPQRENFALCTAGLLLALCAGTQVVQWRGWTFTRCVSLGALTLAAWWLLLPFLATAYRDVPAALGLYGFRLSNGMPGSYGLQVMLQLAFVLLIGGPCYALLAGTLPALLRDGSEAARRSGRLLLVSGAANAAGLLLFVFLLHPRLPFFWVAALVVVGLVAAALLAGPPRDSLDRAALLLAAALVPLLGSLPESMAYTGFRQYPGASIRVFKSGSDDATLVRAGRETLIHYNGLPEIVVTRGDALNPAEVTAGLLPALLAPRRQQALVLGLGTGLTAGAVASVFPRTDVVDLDRASLALTGALAQANFGLLGNPGFRFHHQDARRFLAHPRGGPYDLVVNTTSTPRYFAAAKLYTVEVFDAVRRVLAPGGVYATWFSSGNTSAEGSRMLMAGLASRFRHCALAALRGPYYVIACSDQPLTRQPSAAEVRGDVAAALSTSLGLPVGLDAYLSAIVVTRDAFAGQPPPGEPLNHDDFPRLEFLLRGEFWRPIYDPVAADPERYHIALSVDPGDPASMERALVLGALAPDLFHHFVPRGDPRLAGLQGRLALSGFYFGP